MPGLWIANVAGFDDAPFARGCQGRVAVVGAVYADQRFDGVLLGDIEKDGSDAADRIAQLVLTSRFAGHVRLIMLQGITLGGFNVVDVPLLRQLTGCPVLVVCRHNPDRAAVRAALCRKIPDGRRKWEIIEALGEMEAVNGIYVQRAGLSREQAAATIRRFSIHSRIPEPIRTAHLIAGALATGQSRGAP
ncbi:MAG: DUF99 family protein [Desulfosudaceae bacterium]